ncbi:MULTISPECIES: hypothetical protein [Microbacterium]|uniref:hypothetical protein n=1 Tax=Microbacterium TaxID=33882 RepID=UPI00344B0559
MLRGIASVAGTKVFALLCSFGATVLTIRIISAAYGPSEYGAVSLVAALIMIMPVADLGLSLNLTNQVARGAHTRSWTAFRLSFGPTTLLLCGIGVAVACVFGILGATGLWPALLGDASRLLGDPNSYMPIYGILCGLWVISSPSYRLLAGLGRINTLIVLQSAGPVIAVTATAITAASGGPLVMHAFFPLAGALISTSAGWLIVLPHIRSAVTSAPRIGQLRRMHFASALSAGLSGVLFTVGSQLMFAFDRVLLAQIGTAIALATFAASIALYSAAQSALGSFGTYMWPRYTRRRLDGTLSVKIVLRHTGFFAAIGVLASVSIWFGYPLYAAVAGVRAPADSLFVGTMAVLVFTQALLLAPTSALTTPRLLQAQGAALFGALVVKVSLAVVLIPQFQASGVLIANVLGIWLVQLPTVAYLMTRHLGRTLSRGDTP